MVIEVHKRSLRISNPGGLVKGLNKSNFGKESRPRNRLMADLLLRTDFVEKLGTGISRIKNACEMAGIPLPDFEFDDHNFSITIYSARKEGVDEGVDVPVNVPVNQRQEWILIIILRTGNIQMKTIRDKFKDVSDRTLKRDIEQLKRLGLIYFLGSPKTGKYVLTEKGKNVLKNNKPEINPK